MYCLQNEFINAHMLPGHQIKHPAGQGLSIGQHSTPIGLHVCESLQHCVPCGQFKPFSQNINPSSMQKLLTQQTDHCLHAPVGSPPRNGIIHVMRPINLTTTNDLQLYLNAVSNDRCFDSRFILRLRAATGRRDRDLLAFSLGFPTICPRQLSLIGFLFRCLHWPKDLFHWCNDYILECQPFPWCSLLPGRDNLL